MLRVGFFLFCAIVPLLLDAQPVSIIPPDPDSDTRMTIRVGGIWPDSCIPRNSRVAVSGATITITATTPLGPGIGCLTVVSSWEEFVRVGPLDAGTYRLRILIQDFQRLLTFAERDLVVSEADPIYALDVRSAHFSVTLFDSNGRIITGRPVEAKASGEGRPAFAVFPDLSLLAPAGRVLLTISTDTSVGRFWAFVSVTNNDTQQVTVITPQ